MVFMNIFRQLVRRFSVPIMKSIYNAYQATIKRGAGAGTGPNNNRTQDTFGNYFSGLMSKANLGTSPMTESTAFKILNIEAASLKEADPKVILERYFTLLDKNDPAAGGTIYLQAKIICAKEFLLQNNAQARKLELQMMEARRIAKEQKEEKDKQQKEEKAQQADEGKK